MASAKRDFERFVQWLYQTERQVPENVLRLANLALLNFDELAKTSRQRSQRSTYLVRLLRRELANTVAEAPATATAFYAGTWPWARLQELTVGPFRGFRVAEQFDLSKQVTLIYGPNGSGKTSLCEALEYALLGDVEDAGNKRIEARTYLANIHARRFTPPALTATDHQGLKLDVVASLDTYRFCFVEKNRIDAFSRIAARPNAQRAELIATLFGMDQFSDFVSHFNESIDGQLVLIHEQENTLSALRKALDEDLLTIENAAASELILSTEEAALATEYAAETTYEALKNLIGTSESPGRLQQLEGILETIPPNIYDVNRQELLSALANTQQCGEELDAITATLAARNDEVSFKALYQSVLALSDFVGDRCPACDTPLDGQISCVRDPYRKAADGLRQLEELGDLQEQKSAAEAKIGQLSRELRQIFEPIRVFIKGQAEESTVTGRWLAQLTSEPLGRWWSDIYPAAAAEAGTTPSLNEILTIVDRMAAQDDTSRQAHQDRQAHVDERRRLANFQLRVQSQDNKRKQFKQKVEAANIRINEFNEKNSELVSQVENEKNDIARDKSLKEAYDRFLEELRAYRDQLPKQLMAGLNDTARDFYNAFNRNDRDEEKLSELHLPLGGNGKIEISFRGKPNARVDALHVLSEGHIRCLGLAILMAKAKSIDCPVIVFDDAINAIDHDHRGGIREAIFESGQFAQTQLILTCHSNEFIKDIQQHLPIQQRSSCQVYLLRHHDGDYQPRVRGNIPSANYIAKARSARDSLNDREALTACRQALEMLSEKTWRWLGSHDQGLLNLLLASVGGVPTLRNLCEALSKKLREAKTFNHANRNALVNAYGRLLGIPDNNLVWTYLNKGTHEEAERDDFDGELVETVIQTLEEIDRLDLRPGH